MMENALKSLFMTSNASKHQPTAFLLARFFSVAGAHFLGKECIRIQDFVLEI